jgi:uncharacterized protein with LGFP repeats
MNASIKAMGNIFDVVKGGFEAAEVAVDSLRSVVESLNTARSVVVTVANNTGQPLQLRSHHHDHGNFRPANAPGMIEAKTSIVFGSQSKAGSVATGTEGWVTYGGHDFEVVLHWNNPFVGSNSSHAEVRGARANAVRLVDQSGAGNSRAPFRFDVFEVDMGGFDVYGAILDAWAAQGWKSGPLGLPRGPELATAVAGARFQDFAGGRVVWRNDLGAHIVKGEILRCWLTMGADAFGLPLQDEGMCRDGQGRFQHYRQERPTGGCDVSIYWHPATGAHPVHGAIRDHWAQQGWEHGSLGYPMGPESRRVHGEGAIQRFQGGWLAFAPARGVSLHARNPDSTISKRGLERTAPAPTPLGKPKIGELRRRR